MMSAPRSVAVAEDLLRGHHHAEIDHLEIVALEHHADDVLADVVDVALDRRHHDRALRLAGVAGARLLLLDVRDEMADRLLHHARRLDHLRQEHLARAEEVADDVHPGHQRPLDHLDRPRVVLPRLLGVLDDVRGDALHQRVRKPRLDGAFAPGEVLGHLPALRLERFGEADEALGGVGPPIQHDVLDPLAQFRRDRVVDAELAGVDDAHRHAGADRVVQEDRVDRLAHGLVAAERKADVGDAARNLRVREVRANPARRIDEIDGVVVVLVDPGRDGEHVGIEDDVLGREIDLARQQVVAALADPDLALVGVGLALLVEGHHDHRGAVTAHEPRLAQEFGFAFLERDRVHHRLALHAFQAGLDHLPFRRIDHHRHAGDVGLGGDQVEEPDHRRLRVEHRLVHVDVDDLRAVAAPAAARRRPRPRSRRRGSAWRTRASR